MPHRASAMPPTIRTRLLPLTVYLPLASPADRYGEEFRSTSPAAQRLPAILQGPPTRRPPARTAIPSAHTRGATPTRESKRTPIEFSRSPVNVHKAEKTPASSPKARTRYCVRARRSSQPYHPAVVHKLPAIGRPYRHRLPRPPSPSRRGWKNRALHDDRDRRPRNTRHAGNQRGPAPCRRQAASGPPRCCQRAAHPLQALAQGTENASPDPGETREWQGSPAIHQGPQKCWPSQSFAAGYARARRSESKRRLPAAESLRRGIARQNLVLFFR